MVVDPRIVERKAEIEHVQQMIQSVKDARRDLPLREGERESTLRAVENELAELVPGWTLVELEGFRVTASARAELDELARQEKALRDRKTALDGDQVRLAESLRNARSALARLGDPVDVSVLAGLLDGKAEYTSMKNVLTRLEAEERKAADELAALLPRLNPPLAEPTAAAHALPVPPRETVDQFKLDFAWVQQLIITTEKLLATDEASIESLQKELVILNTGTSEVPTREGLLRAAQTSRRRMGPDPPQVRGRRSDGNGRRPVAGRDASFPARCLRRSRA